MDKDFDKWNEKQKSLDMAPITAFPYPREIWWCVLGLNIGAETDGKGVLFERPVIILKVFNKETILALPITSKAKNDRFHFQIDIHGTKVWIKLTQIRVLSTKRLIRKATTLVSHELFSQIRKKLFRLL